MGIHVPNRVGLHLHEKLHPEVPILFGLLRYLRGDAATLNGVAGWFGFFSIRILFFGAGRNYECCKQPGGGFPHTGDVGGCGTWMWLRDAVSFLIVT